MFIFLDITETVFHVTPIFIYISHIFFIERYSESSKSRGSPLKCKNDGNRMSTKCRFEDSNV